jgi:hypothetical protein
VILEYLSPTDVLDPAPMGRTDELSLVEAGLKSAGRSTPNAVLAMMAYNAALG